MNRNKILIIISIIICIFVILFAILFGSVSISVGEAFSIAGHKLFGHELLPGIAANKVSILWDIRIPRVFTAFLVGSALSLSGVIMQAVLRNPLASSYTLGVSSGASLGVVIVMVTGISIPFMGNFLMPGFGFIFGLITVLAVLASSKIFSSRGEDHTIILMGMVVSLFLNAIITLISSFNIEHSNRILLWQMGSFGGRTWTHVAIILVVTALCFILVLFYTRRMDILTFGREQAISMGVNVDKTGYILLIIASLLTGVSVCIAGIIGFIDLIAPHVVRKLFGASHKMLVPMSLLYGGAFMVIADFISRTLISPREIPVGAVTAIIGAPFFAYVYFRRRR